MFAVSLYWDVCVVCWQPARRRRWSQSRWPRQKRSSASRSRCLAPATEAELADHVTTAPSRQRVPLASRAHHVTRWVAEEKRSIIDSVLCIRKWRLACVEDARRAVVGRSRDEPADDVVGRSRDARADDVVGRSRDECRNYLVLCTKDSVFYQKMSYYIAFSVSV